MLPKEHIKKCGFSLGIVIFGIVLMIAKNAFYQGVLTKVLVLQRDSFLYDFWKINPVPVQLKLYLFNWTNTENSSEKPRFQDLGPYTFDEVKEKVNITWNSNNNTVSFYHLKRWWFNRDKSNGSLDDPVRSINPVALSSSALAKNWNFLLKQGLNVVFRSFDTKLHETHKAGEILFEGYNDSLITMSNKMPTFGLASMPNFDKFGWFYTRNNSRTYEGHYNMDSGQSDQLGKLHSWKFMSQSDFFPGECGKIRGSSLDFFPTNLRKDSIIRFFVSDICRYVELDFEKEVVVNGILGYKFIAGDRFLDNGTKIPENRCFCKGNDCMPYGALDISSCRYGTPSLVSLPHFNKADPHYSRIIDGMRPDNEKHEFFMIFEPKTGLPLHVAARLQVNLLLQPIPGIRLFENVPKVYLPILWFEQTVIIPGSAAILVILLANFELICLILGILSVFCAVLINVCYFYKFYRAKLDNEKIVSKEELPLRYFET